MSSASTAIFIDYIGPSTNKIYAGVHWTVRKKHKAQAAIAVMLAKPLPRFAGAVKIRVTPVLGPRKRAYDVSNYSYTYKMVEDALVDQRVFCGDSAKFITSVELCAPTKGRKSGIVLLITELEEY